MSSKKSGKSIKPPSSSSRASSISSPSSSLSSHLATVELKQKILNSLSKLADRDTHQIAVEDLEKIVQSLTSDGVSMFLNSLYDAVNDPKPAVKKEGLRLFALLCTAHIDTAAAHLTKIIAQIVKRLRDTDSQVRDACVDAIGSLSGLYLKDASGGDSLVSLFVKPLLEAMSENNKAAQGGAALGLAKLVECAADPPLHTFQKLLPRVCKYLNSPNYMAKASLLQVVSSLSQVGAVTPQSFEPLQQSIHACLNSSDWATRKAAAETLIVLGLKTTTITEEAAASTLKVLEACRFDKIKPVRDAMCEALHLWKKIAGKAEGSSDEHKCSSRDGNTSVSADSSYRKDLPNFCDGENDKHMKSSACALSPSDPCFSGKGNNILDKAFGILKKKAPTLSDRELNPEFFQKLETRVSDDLPVEVILPRRGANALSSEVLKGSGSSAAQNESTSFSADAFDEPHKTGHDSTNTRTSGDHADYGNKEPATVYKDFSRSTSQSEEYVNNKGYGLAIQRQLSLLERQQAHLMNMLQDYMGGSHDSMVTLENRVRGLERVVEEMVRDLSVSSSKRGGSCSLAGVDGSSSRYHGRYNCFPDFPSSKFGRGSDTRINFGERFPRGPCWRPDASNSWNFHAYGRNGTTGSRRDGALVDIRSGDPENEADHAGSKRACEKGGGPIRFGEGPSARSVWQASKDEATLEAIRVAGEENGVSRGARVGIPEMTAEALGDDGSIQDRNPVWNAWSNAMDALHAGDLDAAFAEVLSTGDDALLVKLMDRSGPVMDQLSHEIASEVVGAISQLLMDQNFFDTCLSWAQQLADIAIENGPDAFGIPMEIKRDILLNLHDSSSSVELPEDWEGPASDQVLVQLASAWEINLQELLT